MFPTFASLATYPAPIRLAIFLLSLLSLWLPLAVPIYWLVEDPNTVSIATMVLLYGEFLLLLQFWGRKVYRQPRLLKSYGLERTKQNGLDLLKGFSIGLVSLLCLLVLEGLLGWVELQALPIFQPRVILEGFLVALAIGFAEELLFRGWLLDELQRDYTMRASLWCDAFLYALLHFIKPLQEILRTWVEFPGLLLLGLIFVWAKRGSQGRLGLSIGLHAGLVWGYYIVDVGQLVRDSGIVPGWVIGIDGNPLAGMMGLLFLGAIAAFMFRASLRSSRI